MATFEGYLRGLTGRSSVRQHSLTVEIDEQNRLKFRIHPQGVSCDEVPTYFVNGTIVESAAFYTGDANMRDELNKSEDGKLFLKAKERTKVLWNKLQAGALISITKGVDSSEFEKFIEEVDDEIYELKKMFEIGDSQ